MVDTSTSPSSPPSVATSLVPAPATFSSSLQGDCASDKALIESWMAQGPAGPYYRGDPQSGWSAPRIQAHYADLLRGELQGLPELVGPMHAPDDDLPLGGAEGYSLASIDGIRSIDRADRDLIDSFAAAAHAAGFGQKRFAQAVGWGLTIPGLSVSQFKDLAIAANWSDRAIESALAWYRKEFERQAGKT